MRSKCISSAHVENPVTIVNRYIQFFLDVVSSSDNIALLYHIALKAKTVRDAESHVYSEVSIVRALSSPDLFSNPPLVESVHLRGARAVLNQRTC